MIIVQLFESSRCLKQASKLFSSYLVFFWQRHTEKNYSFQNITYKSIHKKNVDFSGQEKYSIFLSLVALFCDSNMNGWEDVIAFFRIDH